MIRRAATRWLARVLHFSGLLALLRRSAGRYRLSGTRTTGRFPKIGRRRTGALTILAYHRVAPHGDGFLEPMPVDDFAGQMRVIARSYRVLDIDEAAAAIEARDVPPNAVVLTFDDGYRDNLTHALPVLESLSLKATVFLVTDVIGTGRIIWHDRVFRAFSDTKCTLLREFGPGGRDYPMNSAEQVERCQEGALRYLKSLDPDRRDREIADLLARLEVEDVATAPGLMLSWDEVREMRRRGISFGAHTASHPILSRVSPAVARAEVAESKRCIERELGRPVSAFAYPNGKPADFDDAVKRTLADVGYRCAVTTIPGVNDTDDPRGVDRMALRRVGLSDADVPAFATKLFLARWSAG